METYQIICLIISAAVVIAVVFSCWKSGEKTKGKPREEEKSKTDETIIKDSSEPEVSQELIGKLSETAPAPAPVSETHEEKYAKIHGKWVCPRCENMVDNSSCKCGVCGYRK